MITLLILIMVLLLLLIILLLLLLLLIMIIINLLLILVIEIGATDERPLAALALRRHLRLLREAAGEQEDIDLIITIIY